jgi:hypothetical protein
MSNALHRSLTSPLRSLAKPIILGILIATTITVYAGDKRPNDECQEDSDCRRGHCYTKRSDSKKVCVDCSASKIEETRAKIAEYCKEDDRTCTNFPGAIEIAESVLTKRIELNDKCIAARKDENDSCWDGGDDSHRHQLAREETVRARCKEELDTRKGTGMLYTCSDSTFSSRVADVDSHCTAYGSACDGYGIDERVVDCTEIEKAMEKTGKCISAVEWLDSDCLPRLSQLRESQFGKAKKAYDSCKQILEHKKSKGLCR